MTYCNNSCIYFPSLVHIQMQKQNKQMLQPCISIFFQHLWVIKRNKQQVFKHRLALKVIRPIAVMTPTESCGLGGVSVTPSHHVSQSQQRLVLPVHYPPNTICPNPQLWLPQTLPHRSSHGSARQRLPGWERGNLWWFHLLVFTCQVKQP